MVEKAKLRGKIVEAGYTQRSLAKAMGIAENTLSNKINGKTSFDAQEITKICKLLGNMTCSERVHIFLQ